MNPAGTKARATMSGSNQTRQRLTRWRFMAVFSSAAEYAP
jgi:hypothetical protein